MQSFLCSPTNPVLAFLSGYYGIMSGDFDQIYKSIRTYSADSEKSLLRIPTNLYWGYRQINYGVLTKPFWRFWWIPSKNSQESLLRMFKSSIWGDEFFFGILASHLAGILSTSRDFDKYPIGVTGNSYLRDSNERSSLNLREPPFEPGLN